VGFLLCSIAVLGQHRPKIGLVLSGGGAKGIAHIGVLKVLERAGITPDYITGTSMGSVVGGLYAMGYSAGDLEKIINDIDWDKVLANKVPLNEIAIEEKPFYNRYALELPVTKFFKVAFPGGIIQGQKLQQMFLDLTRPVHDINDFNKLPIPFACVAADIATGNPVLLNKGSLAQCMRASMAIPTVFTPVEIDGKLLVDGGLVRNFPVQEAKDMGADIVIGVFVSSDLASKEELNGFMDILFQSAWVLSANDSRKQKGKVDYYLEPKDSSYGTGDFKLAKFIMKKGEEEAEKFFPAFKKLADSIYAIEPRRKLTLPTAVNEYAIDSIHVVGSNKIPPALVKAKFGLKENTLVSAETIEKQTSLLFGTQHYSTVSYQIHGNDSSSYNLELNVVEAIPGKLKAAVHYDTENKAGINLNLTVRNLLLPDSRVLMELDLAEFPRATFNYLKYVSNHQNIAAMMNADYNSFEASIQNGTGSSSLFSIDTYSVTATLFTTASTNHTFGASIVQNYIQLKPKITGTIIQNIEYIRNNGPSAQVFFLRNTLERPFFPRRGNKTLLSLNGYFNSALDVQYTADTVATSFSQKGADFLRFDLGYQKIFSVDRKISIITDVRTTFSGQPSQDGYTIIGTTFFGGFHPRTRDSYAFYGAHNYDYSALSYLLAKTDMQVELLDHLFVTAGLNYLGLTNPRKWFDKNYSALGDPGTGRTWRLGYGLSVGYMTVIGPITLGITMDSQRTQLLSNFSIGFYY
jgi:NTE family protein